MMKVMSRSGKPAARVGAGRRSAKAAMAAMPRTGTANDFTNECTAVRRYGRAMVPSWVGCAPVFLSPSIAGGREAPCRRHLCGLTTRLARLRPALHSRRFFIGSPRQCHVQLQARVLLQVADHAE